MRLGGDGCGCQAGPAGADPRPLSDAINGQHTAGSGWAGAIRLADERPPITRSVTRSYRHAACAQICAVCAA